MDGGVPRGGGGKGTREASRRRSIDVASVIGVATAAKRRTRFASASSLGRRRKKKTKKNEQEKKRENKEISSRKLD